MNKKKLLALALVATLSLGVLAGCGGTKPAADPAPATDVEVKELIPLKVGATPAPHAEILAFAKDALAVEGYDLEIVDFVDYVQPNMALYNKELDANFFQHFPYLEDFNKEHGFDLASAGIVHYEPMGIFPGRVTSLDGLKTGSKIAVPNDPTNEARALLLLAEQGLLTIDETAGIKATKNDIIDNPLQLDIVEIEAAQVPRAMPDVDLGVINGNYALAADVDLATALAIEEADSLAAKTYGNVIAVRADDLESDKIKALAKVLTGSEVAKFIEDTYAGAVVPMK